MFTNVVNYLQKHYENKKIKYSLLLVKMYKIVKIQMHF